VSLEDDLRRIADAAVRYTADGEELAGIVPAEPSPGRRAYLCAFRRGEANAWVVLDDEGRAVDRRADVRAVLSIAALCEVAEEVAGGGDLDELRSQLVALRVTENPAGIDEAQEAAIALQEVIGGTPRLATPAHLDAVGAATMGLEQALGSAATGSPFAAAMKQATETVEELTRDVETSYKVPFAGSE
jgi:hypothetical protein